MLLRFNIRRRFRGKKGITRNATTPLDFGLIFKILYDKPSNYVKTRANQTSFFRWFAANIGWFVDNKVVQYYAPSLFVFLSVMKHLCP